MASAIPEIEPTPIFEASDNNISDFSFCKFVKFLIFNCFSLYFLVKLMLDIMIKMLANAHIILFIIIFFLLFLL